ncbi:MAG: glycosyltransferase family 9 protein [Spirochaetia bacterium]|nr:glycosyltransferase family 9 protein [Spirochaetia bacterium]
MLKNVRNILIVKLRDIGDIVLSTPVINVLNDACQSPRITYLLKKEYENFKYLLPHTAEVITYDKKNPFDFIRVAARLRSGRFDLAVNLHASFRSALITYLSGAKFRLVHNHSGSDYFTSVPLGIKEETKSIIERDLDTLAPLKLGEPTVEQKKTRLVLNDDYTRYIDDEEIWLTVGLGIGAKRENKMWPADRFASLGLKLVADGYNIAVFCANSERKKGEDVVGSIGPKAKLYCGLDFLRLAFFLNKLRLFAGNDSGLRHMAAALGIKTVTLFGPENPVEWHPYSEKDGHIGISHLHDFVAAGVDVTSRQFREKSAESIEKITVEEVYAAARSLLQPHGTAK